MMPRIDRIFQRHVHLDFHTSEHIENIGGRFSRANFQAALKAGRLDGITVFAKCHHSWCYYPTTVGRPHPHLQCDLLGEQVAAAHEIGVRIPIYITVGWSANDAEDHPEWLQRTREGQPATCNFDLTATPETPKPICSWKFLCPSGAYRDHIVALTAEIGDRYEVDGLFYDICGQGPCFCDHCLAGMAAAGLDPDDAADARAYNLQRWTGLMDECNQVLHDRHAQATVFYNGNAGLTTAPEILDRLTHFELEDLPTTWGGYDKLPLRAKYFMALGKPRCAMSGKFHTMWGEFGGFKHPDAMWLEAATMVAFGTGCSFGDQVHPDGEMELATYEWIGRAYEHIAPVEQYGPGDSASCASLGLWLCGDEAHDQGVANMLLETQTDFDLVGRARDLSGFETVILPGGPGLDAVGAEQLAAFSASGGGLLVLGEGALACQGEQFLLELGARYLGPGQYDCDYTVAGEALAAELPPAAFLNYEPALRCELSGGEVLATLREPYFSRTYGHFCSHQNTANRREPAAHPGAVRHGRTVYLPHALGRLYYRHGARVHRQLFANALALVHQRPLIEADLPSGGRVNLLHQPGHRRYVAHLVYGPPTSRGRCQIIEDLLPLYDVPLRVRLPQSVKRASLAPQGELLACRQAGDQLALTVPKLHCHQVVVFDY